MVTYHPVTLESNGASSSLINLLNVLDEYPDHQLIITYPNADTNGRKLIKILDDYKTLNQSRVLLVQSLGQLRYLSLMKYCEAVIGNSSSGLIETPSFKVPTVNIGNRQKGRIGGDTVVSCDDSVDSIRHALEKALSQKFKLFCQDTVNPYGQGDSSARIVEQLINYPLNKIINKKFNDFEDIE